LADVLSPDALAHTGEKLLDLSTKEKVPNITILILQTVHFLRKHINDKHFDENAKIMYNTMLNDADSDVSYYAKLYCTSQ